MARQPSVATASQAIEPQSNSRDDEWAKSIGLNIQADQTCPTRSPSPHAVVALPGSNQLAGEEPHGGSLPWTRSRTEGGAR